jgi:peptidoglycan/xylan/chitin deacetylase (PgdA/CDA1 family)
MKGGLSREQRYMAKSILAALPRAWRRASGRIVVLCYHSVHPTNAFASATPRQFDEQVRWIRDHCEVVPLPDALDRARRPRSGSSIPVVSVTFDDGYEDNVVHALPVLVRYGITASFFVTTGFVDRDPAVMDHMRRMRGMVVSPMTWKQLSEMREAGMGIGSHTATHPNLAELADDALLVELRDSRRTLEDRLGAQVDSVAYPYGIPGRHVTARTVEMARRCGYRTGMSILYRDVRQHDEPLNIPRIAVKNNSLQVLRGKIAGSLDVIGRRQERAAAAAFSDDGSGEVSAS